MKLRHKIFTTIGILGAAALIILGVIVYPSAKAIDDLAKGISAQKLTIEERYLRLQQIRSSLKGLGDARQKTAALAGLAVHEGRELDFINALEAAAAEAGVEQDINLETANQKDLSKWEREIPLTLKVSGPYPSLLRYLSELERLPYMVNVRSLQLETATESRTSNPRGIVDMRIQAMVYRLSKNAPEFLNPAP
ncbi:type 4a pilus biogenesis protein PilO [Candidatus Uhrbacteria bacterium]|nr:type 4a pilus biogenesis protein PilO [Candidatus Uhrbacteria bacterium]